MEEKQNVVTTPTVEKEGSKFGWGLLGFFIPLVGLILFLVWKKDKKKAAKAAGIGALVGFLLGLVSTIIMFALGFGTIVGIGVASDYYENTDTKTKTEEKKKDDKTTKKEEVKKEETKKDENKTDSKTEPTPNPCDVKAQARDGSKWNISYSYELSSCETTNIVDDNNNVLFKFVKGNYDVENKIITNNGVELEAPNKEYWKLNDSIVLYSKMCSPGYCYVYVYNTKDNTGFRVDNSLASDIIFPLTIKGIDSDINNNLVVKMEINESAGMESIKNDPRYKAYKKIKSCEIKDINAALAEYNLDDFTIGRSFQYYNVNGTLTQNDPYILNYSIKGYNNNYCNR